MRAIGLNVMPNMTRAREAREARKGIPNYPLAKVERFAEYLVYGDLVGEVGLGGVFPLEAEHVVNQDV